MSKDKADLISHPVRTRILAVLMGRKLTTAQIAALLPDIPVASLYRHIKTLFEGGALRVAGEVRLNGTLTKVYATVPGMTYLNSKDVEGAGKAEHLEHFTTFLNTQAQIFQTMLEQNNGDIPVSSVTASSLPLYLTSEEAAEFRKQLRAFLRSWQEQGPNSERKRWLFSTILFPDLTEPPRE